jgi:transcriptional regulator with PAS, ATPase and Fis domain
LHQWLSLSPPGISVIAVTAEPLFPLVQRGAFRTDLFYRLNLIVIDVTG